jgi:hypothetical protein
MNSSKEIVPEPVQVHIDSWQSTTPQLTVPFASRCTWLAFTDQVLHAAMGGQYMLEQTFHLLVSAMKEESKSPLRILERLAGRTLAG